MPDAEIIAVGSEMLTSQRVDTNSLFLADHLNALGVELRRKLVVGDDRAALTQAVSQSLAQAEIVILSGGLGPTEDDLTRDAVAAATGRGMSESAEIIQAIENRFRNRGRTMPEINRRQAFILDGAEILPNPNGTAPGQWLEHAGRILILLPGPPSELKPLFTQQCLPRLERMLPGQVIRTRVYRITGLTESDLDQLIAPVYTKYTNPVTTVLAHIGDMQVHLRARCASAEQAEALLAEVGAPIEALLANKIYSRNGEPLEAVIGQLLRARDATLAVAESITGGFIGERITSVPGSSAYFLGGFIVYSDRMKQALLNVPAALLAQHTAVSAEVAQAMAEGAREKTGADYALSVTGEAGPDSATGVAPGTVFVGLAGPEGSETRQFRLPGGRDRVRGFGSMNALDFLRRRLSGMPATDQA